jgi:Fe2+ or Zn2+ uptake regulation protein
VVLGALFTLLIAIVPVQPYIDIATVYRVLQWLQSVGFVAPISTGEGKLYYEYRRLGEYHHHLVCQHRAGTSRFPTVS